MKLTVESVALFIHSQETENDEQQRQSLCTTFNQSTFPQPFHLSPIFPKVRFPS